MFVHFAQEYFINGAMGGNYAQIAQISTLIAQSAQNALQVFDDQMGLVIRSSAAPPLYPQFAGPA
jgi:hypothetical protein